MAVHQIERMTVMSATCSKLRADVEALFRDLLIGVTCLFRDPDAFRAFQEQAIAFLTDKPTGASIRVWVPGCSTGEEAYSLAILLQERMETLKQNFKLQVFATDIDHRAIECARTGIYPASIVSIARGEIVAASFGAVYANRVVSFADIEAARERSKGAVYYSPCLPSIPLSELTGMEIFCKLDNLQRTGSFKERGARNVLSQLPAEQKKRGVIAASAGNHGQALAYQGKLLGVPATVVMPKHAPLIKVSNCQKLGARVVLHGKDFAEAKTHAHEIAAKDNAWLTSMATMIRRSLPARARWAWKFLSRFQTSMR